MSVHLQREIDRLKKRLLSICALVEEQVEAAVRSLTTRDVALAREVERRDVEIDQREVEVEEDCLKVLALYQPVAIDLRLIVAALKINNDLERIGDMAVNIAHKGITVAGLPSTEIPFDLDGMWEKTQTMLHDSIDALVNLDTHLASVVCGRDDEVDTFKRDIRLKSQQLIVQNPSRVEFYLNLMAVARNLERIADLATNIAEDVIYMAEGQIVRHGLGKSG
jgi:phosphate transport system protein